MTPPAMASRMRVAPASTGTSSRAGRPATSAYASVGRRRARAGLGGPARERSTPLPAIARRPRTTTVTECRTTPSMPCVSARPRRRGRAASTPARTARGVAWPEPRPASSRPTARPARGARARVASGRRPPTPARRAMTTTATATPTRAAPASRAALRLAALPPRSESARRARRPVRAPPGAPASGRCFPRRATAPRRWTMTATDTPTTRSIRSVSVRQAATQACGQHPGQDGNGPCKAGSQTCAVAADKKSSAWGSVYRLGGSRARRRLRPDQR